MKKVILLMAVLVGAAPAWAAVTVSANCDGDRVTVGYVTDGNNIRAFALDVTVDNGATITSVDDLSDDVYYVHPGSVQIDEQTGEITGSLVCDPCEYAGTLPGIGSYGITIEAGSLYVGEANAPDPCGVLFTFTVDRDCNVTLAENAIRGGANFKGVVMEDPYEYPEVTLVGCRAQVGPACQHCPYWALGDIDGSGWVNAADVVPIINNLGAPASANPCADLDKSGYINAADVVPIINNLGAGDGVPCP